MKTIRCKTLLAFSLTEILVAIVVIAVLMALLFTGASHVSTIGKRTACVATIRNLHVALHLYAAENNNCLPTGGKVGGSTWTGRIAKYLSRPITKAESDTYCPATRTDTEDILYKRDRATWRTDYNVNSNVMRSDENLNRLATTPGNLVLLYDGGGGARGSAADSKATARHGGHFNVIFVDGHVEMLKTFDEHKDLWKKP